MSTNNTSRQTLLIGVALLVVLLLISGIHPYDRATWLMEVFPIFIAVPVVWVTHERFPLTKLLYLCIFFCMP